MAARIAVARIEPPEIVVTAMPLAFELGRMAKQPMCHSSLSSRRDAKPLILGNCPSELGVGGTGECNETTRDRKFYTNVPRA